MCICFKANQPFHIYMCDLIYALGSSQGLGSEWSAVLFFCLFVLIYLFTLLYNIVLVLPYIDLNPPWVYMCF